MYLLANFGLNILPVHREPDLVLSPLSEACQQLELLEVSTLVLPWILALRAPLQLRT